MSRIVWRRFARQLCVAMIVVAAAGARQPEDRSGGWMEPVH